MKIGRPQQLRSPLAPVFKTSPLADPAVIAGHPVHCACGDHGATSALVGVGGVAHVGKFTYNPAGP